MERRFDMSDFEQSLKDYADQFKIMPSKRVWNGIYNRLHPGSKWPSITVAIVFIITLVSIGYLNNSPKRLTKTLAASSAASSSKTDKNNNESIFGNSGEKSDAGSQLSYKSAAVETSSTGGKLTSSDKNGKNNKTIFPTVEVVKKGNQNKTALTATVLPDKNSGKNKLQSEVPFSKRSSAVNQQITSNLTSAEQGDFVLAMVETVPENGFWWKNALQTGQPDFQFAINKREPISFNFINNIANNTTDESTELKVQGTTTVTKKASKKKKNNISWLYYIEPTISYVSLHSKDLSSSNFLNSSSLVVLTNQSPFNLIRNPRPGFEAGIQAGFHITKKLQLISGFNLRYSAFSNVSNLVHPTFASLILQDNSGNYYTKNYITHYGNGESQSQFPLVNYQLTTSIPLGLQYSIWKNDKIELNLTSVVEPSFVLKSNAYVISSDGRYYVNDPDLLRKMNVHGKFGSYISFYAKKVKLHIGPDIRYQFFSTYKDTYPTKEHFIDYGIRIGISR